MLRKAVFWTDYRAMQGLDMFCLFLWYFFKVERIWVQRITLSIYGAASFVSFFIDTPPSHWGVTVGLGFFYAFAALVFGLLHWRSELIAKQPKKVQNAIAMTQRMHAGGWRVVCLAFVVLLIIPDIIEFNEFSILNVMGLLSWFIMMVGDSIFVSEDPPKKWKKITLPKFVFNTHLPQPQGA